MDAIKGAVHRYITSRFHEIKTQDGPESASTSSQGQLSEFMRVILLVLFPFFGPELYRKILTRSVPYN
jgi:hypothetical protein